MQLRSPSSVSPAGFALAVLCSLPLAAQFEYDRAAPLDSRQEPMAEYPAARLWGGSFASGGRVNFVLVEPKLRGRHPGVIFQHGGGQSLFNYIPEAVFLAEAGVTSLIVDTPGAISRESVIQLVVAQRRAVDLLLRQPGVDNKRIAHVGHSFGGFAGAILAATEPRIAAFILIGAVPSLARHIRESPSDYWDPYRSRPDAEKLLAQIAEVDADRLLPQSKAPVFVQCASFDSPDNLRACPEVHRLAGGPKKLAWYDDNHAFTSINAMLDRLYWLDFQLQLGGVQGALRRWARAKRSADMMADSCHHAEMLTCSCAGRHQNHRGQRTDFARQRVRRTHGDGGRGRAGRLDHQDRTSHSG